jgi:hypothetical protein|nr:MAG TPA_asm: hypothetical protein [Caudoviricetes sp.]
MPRVYIQDIRAAGMCNHGAREWFRIHNLDWFDFLQNGISFDVAEQFSDVDAKAVLQFAIKREKENKHGC